MYTRKLTALFVAALLIAGTTVGCDNRSQMEKDADKALGQMEKDAGKALDKIGN